MVGMERFELSTPCSRSRCATRLRYIPIFSYRDAEGRRANGHHFNCLSLADMLER